MEAIFLTGLQVAGNFITYMGFLHLNTKALYNISDTQACRCGLTRPLRIVRQDVSGRVLGAGVGCGGEDFLKVASGLWSADLCLFKNTWPLTPCLHRRRTDSRWQYFTKPIHSDGEAARATLKGHEPHHIQINQMSAWWNVIVLHLLKYWWVPVVNHCLCSNYSLKTLLP